MRRAWQKRGERYVGRHVAEMEFNTAFRVAGIREVQESEGEESNESSSISVPESECEVELGPIEQPVAPQAELSPAEPMAIETAKEPQFVVEPVRMEIEVTEEPPVVPPAPTWYEQVVVEEEEERSRQREAERESWARRKLEEEQRLALVKTNEEAMDAERKLMKERERDERAVAAEARKSQQPPGRPWLGPNTLTVIPPPLTVPITGPLKRAREMVGGERTTHTESGGKSPRSTVSQGAIPKGTNGRLIILSQEERESREAAHELDRYLKEKQECRSKPTSQVTSIQQEWGRALRLVPISSVPVVENEENWDLEATASRPRRPSAAGASSQSSGQGNETRKKKKKKKYNEHRHLEADDYVSRYASRTPSPELFGSSQLVCREPVQHRTQPMEVVNRREPPEEEHRARGFPVRLRGIKFGGLIPIPTDPRVDPPPFTCFNCWQKGHAALKCPRPKVQTFCYNGGRRGVDLAVCPRCSEPHRQFVEREYRGNQRQGILQENSPPSFAGSTSRGRQRIEDVPRLSRSYDSSQASARRPNNTGNQEEELRRREEKERCSKGESSRTSEAASATTSSVRTRLGPRVEVVSVGQRDAVREALQIIQGIIDLPVETRDAVLRHLYLETAKKG